jgi:hypothetical protein
VSTVAAMSPAPALVVTNTAVAAESQGTETPKQKQQEYVQTRSAELMDLGMKDDAESLRTIPAELTNRDPEIRKAAVEAAVQFSSRDAIPALTDAAAQTDDPQEKVMYQEAIEFLKLPSLSEVIQQRKQAAPQATGR